MNRLTMLGRPSAFVPVAMSLGALATVFIFLALHGPAPQAPIALFFAIKWVPQSPSQAVPILALQVGAALAAMVPVFLLHWQGSGAR